MTAITNFIQALQTYPFLQNALITAILIGIMSGLIGSFIILRGMSLMGDAISHSVLPGVALAYMLGLNVLLGASLFGFLAALLIGYISSKSPLKMDTTIGVVFSSLYALGFVLIHFTQSSTNLHQSPPYPLWEYPGRQPARFTNHGNYLCSSANLYLPLLQGTADHIPG